MVPIFRPWRRANGIRSGSRAMVPSSFMISQITPLGFSPASRLMSTLASVWPARTSTPPSRATSGNTWPGETICSGPLAASMATATVRARSAAEMPVVTPSFASIDTVKAVEWRVPLCCAISGRPRAFTRSAAMARQIRPRPYLAMKLMASGVAIWPGMIRSPSFSRSSSSTRIYMRPLRASSMISSIGDRAGPALRSASQASSLRRVSAVGFQSASSSARRLLACRPAARAMPALVSSPLATRSRSRAIRDSLITWPHILM